MSLLTELLKLSEVASDSKADFTDEKKWRAACKAEYSSVQFVPFKVKGQKGKAMILAKTGNGTFGQWEPDIKVGSISHQVYT